LVPFNRSFFEDTQGMAAFVKQCDVIVHLAAMNRHDDPQVIYDTNVNLVSRLVSACENEKVSPHILFSSSSQESKDNLYGKSKKMGKQLFIDWANRSDGTFTSLTIPNVFGPFGKPNYNSVVATFCHKIARNEAPTIMNDSEVGLIYINDLVAHFISVIQDKAKTKNIAHHSFELTIEPNTYVKVSHILNLLTQYKEDCF
jgi:UDP-2-acetamido-2,6-beta-L-arabino-hexul-4-ose reductase